MPYLVDSRSGDADLGAKFYYIWGGACFLCIFFTYFFIYETKNLNLEEIDELFEKVGSARDSTKFVPTNTFERLQDGQNRS